MSTIEITGLRVRPLLVPLRRPLTVSFGVFREAPMLAVQVETRGGGVGQVLGFTFHPLGLHLLPPVLAFLADRARGRTISITTIEAEHDDWQKSLMLLGHEGVTQMALSFFDIAVYDALARAAGVPLYRLLGGQPDDLTAYNSCGGGLLSAGEAAQEALDLMAEHGGFRHVKLRLG
ncbi:MAG: hypothetical protein N2690_12800, partial [Rhodocyclaceae bacterium]|nr:hypothetical protein [Rhodocyclaceae bacterium]